MSRKFKVVGIGEILWDMLPHGKVLGGAPANFAYHASELGAEGFAVSAIGNDSLGDGIIDRLSPFAMKLRLARLEYPTGTVKVKLNDKGIPEYEIIKDVAWDFIPINQSDLELASVTDAVCFGSLAQRNECSRSTIQKFVKCVPETSLKIFDINLRQNFYSKELLDSSLNLSNVLKINDDELEVISELFKIKGSFEKICTQLISCYNLQALALTCGIKGSYLFKDEEISYMATPAVDVKDTIGAGDSFTAGMVMGLLHQKSLKMCHSIAVNISAYVCMHNGAMPPHASHLHELFH